MNNTVTSLIRTYVPIIVGALIAYLTAHGIELDPEAQTGLIVFLTALLQAVYYLIARLLEKINPFFGVLLGSQQVPVYVDSSNAINREAAK